MGDRCRKSSRICLGGDDHLVRVPSRSHPRTKNLAVVVLTSSSEETDMVKSYNLGCNSYVRKPIDFLEFNEAVRQLGLYWLILNQQPSGAR